VTAEKRLTVNLEITLTGGNQTINPREEALGAVIRVQNDRNTVLFGHGTDMEGSTDSTSDRSPVVCVVQTLSTVELGTTRGKLNDNRCVGFASGLETCVDTRRTHTVDGRDSVACRSNVESCTYYGGKRKITTKWVR